MQSSCTMNFSSRVPANQASHFSINDPHGLVIVNYTVELSKLAVYEAHAWVSIDV